MSPREDDAEFEAFVAACYRRLLQVAYLLTCDVGRAEDLLQTALLKTWSSWRRLRPEAAEAYVRTPTCRVEGDLTFGPDPSWLSGLETCGDMRARRYLVQVDVATGARRRLADLPGGPGATWIDYDAPRANLLIELRDRRGRMVWDGHGLHRLPALDPERDVDPNQPWVLWKSEW
jgi:Sigma-70 region 2